MHRVTRSLAPFLALVVSTTSAGAAPLPATPPATYVPLGGGAVPQFVQPLPVLATSTEPLWATNPKIETVVADANPLTVRMCEFQSRILPTGTPVAAAPAAASPLTWTWGYTTGACPTAPRETYIGPVIVAKRGTPTAVRYVNELGTTATTNVGAFKWSTDQTLHWADPAHGAPATNNDCMMFAAMWAAMNPMVRPAAYPGPGVPAPAWWMGASDLSYCTRNYAGPIAAVPHLHGGEVPPEIDGSPDSWFTSAGGQGHKYYSAAGAAANEAIYRYPNSQEAGPLWFHDHTLGATRLNVYAGLAGAYVLDDDALWGIPNPATRVLPAGLQPVSEIVPLVLQDRMFDLTGELYFPAASYNGLLAALNPEHPYWNPEFVGDTIVVNGKAWPFLTVQPKRYRFLVLNGSNARTYTLSLSNGNTPMWVIGTDGGYVDTPQAVQSLTIMPGERYEVIIDFAGQAGRKIILRNTARTPFPGGTPPPGTTLGQIVQFRVQKPAAPIVDASYDPALGGAVRTGATITPLRNALTGASNVTPSIVRQLTLNEVMGMGGTFTDPVSGLPVKYPGGPMEILVNNTKWSGMEPGTMAVRSDFRRFTDLAGFDAWVSELPREGETEQWEIVNLTADAHPIHLHLVQFQLLNRQTFDTRKYNAAYALAFPGQPGAMAGMGCTPGVFCPGFGPPLRYDQCVPPAVPATRSCVQRQVTVGATTTAVDVVGGNPDVTPMLMGGPTPPGVHEQGWKDTVMAPPGTVTRLLVRYAPTTAPIVPAVASELTYPFDPTGGGNYNYVWHCHIIDHEDNEMMRPAVVQASAAAPATRPYAKGAY